MKGLWPLFCGIFATFTFSWIGLALIPNAQIGHLDPQSDEDGTDIYPMPQSGMVERGRKVYTANGCFYCHSQQLRPDYAASDLERTRDLNPHPKWGVRRSAPRDYVFDRPVQLGKMRDGPDLANIGKSAPAEDQNAAPAAGASPAGSPAAAPGQSASPAAAGSPAAVASAAPAAAKTSPASANGPAAASPAPGQSALPGASPASPPDAGASAAGQSSNYSAAWHHRHLYSPRSMNLDSNMPAYRFLYAKRYITGERSEDALALTGTDAPPTGWEIVPSYDARCLVAYLMSLDQSHPLNEVKSSAPPAPAKAPAK
jgi:cbb3-type cytochrome oxidase cytochrome c subunit